jgi:hypothetical protein
MSTRRPGGWGAFAISARPEVQDERPQPDCRGDRHQWRVVAYDRESGTISYRCARCRETKGERT